VAEAEFRKKLDVVWRKKESEHDVGRVPSELRRMLEKRCLGVDHGSAVDLRDFEEDVDSFLRDEYPVIVLLVQMQAATPQAEALPDSVKLRERQRIYQKPFRRRLQILDFVAQRWVPFAYLLQRELDTAGRRIDWKNVCAEWNKAHPYDTMAREHLRVMYARATRERYLRETYFDSKFGDWARQADRLRLILKPLELSGRRPEDLFVRSATFDSSKLSGMLPPEIAKAFARAGWPKEGLTVSAKYPAELVRARHGVARRRRRADKRKRQRPKWLVCRGRACDYRSGMLIWWSPDITAIFRSYQCRECPVASRMMSKLPSD